MLCRPPATATTDVPRAATSEGESTFPPYVAMPSWPYLLCPLRPGINGVQMHRRVAYLNPRKILQGNEHRAAPAEQRAVGDHSASVVYTQTDESDAGEDRRIRWPVNTRGSAANGTEFTSQQRYAVNVTYPVPSCP